ncbi:DNA-directed RNA polymerase subunit alpha [PVC group bacterium]|nr:DNA-directed RNA polymerase subunit alpha [PVC group bacterium]
MVIKWKCFEMPKRLACDTESLTEEYGKFIAEPFERGFGHTLGNSLRRILLSSLESYAITNIKIDTVSHEFTTIEGVLEDVPEVVVNLRKIVFRSSVRTPKTLFLNINKKGDVLARDIELDGTIEILNPEQHVCTLDSAVNLKMELHLEIGRGFVPADRNKKEPQVIDVIPMDSNFSPVTRVNYFVDDSRVGQVTDFDRLIIEIYTNGSIHPQDALVHSALILKEHMEIFVDLDLTPEVERQEVVMQDPMEQLMKKPIDELELSVRSANCLTDAEINTIGELVIKSEQDLLKYRNFGKKSLDEIKGILQSVGLSLNMQVTVEANPEEKPQATEEPQATAKPQATEEPRATEG